MALTVPSDFGRYRLLSVLGQGGMGAVYLAQDQKLGRRVALKVPRKEEIEPILLERFLREARIAAQIEHPNICRVYDVGEFEGRSYLTMEYIEGTPLSRMISPDHPWPLYNAAQLIRKVALAVHVLHQHDVVHRDLKPANIVLRPQGEPVLMDFGLARSFQGQFVRLTSTGEFMGTPAYMSPEQANARNDLIGPATDIYSLGVILYELTTGRLPFTGDGVSLLVKVVSEDAPPPSTFNRELPTDFDLVCLKALAKNPEDRFASADAFATALMPFLDPRGEANAPRGTPTIVNDDARRAVTVMGNPEPALRTTMQTVAGSSAGAPPHAPLGTQSATIPDAPTLPASPAPVAPPPLNMPVVTSPFLLFVMGGILLLTALLWSWSLGYGPDSASVAHPFGQTGKEEEPTEPPGKQPLVGDPWGDRVVNSLGMSLVRIPRGKFTMGSGAAEEGGLAHEVEITSDFYMSVCEVTQQQFRLLTGGNPSAFHRSNGGGLDHPVDSVTWDEAKAFCAKLSALPAEQQVGRLYRLPTEAEWEYACRAGSTTTYPWGDDPHALGEHAWYLANAGDRSHPVGQKKANRWGLFDMGGNVWEWCGDRFQEDYYRHSPRQDPEGPSSGEARVLRGGGWNSSATECLPRRRFSDSPAVRDHFIGFRVVAVRAGR